MKTLPHLLLISMLFPLLACQPALSSHPSPAPSVSTCSLGSEIGRALISGAQMGEGTTVAFTIRPRRTPSAVAVLDQNSSLVACAYITHLPGSQDTLDIPLAPVGDSPLNGTAHLSWGEGSYEGRLQITLTTRGNSPFSPYWAVLIGD
jgi:hypothetical protein